MFHRFSLTVVLLVVLAVSAIQGKAVEPEGRATTVTVVSTSTITGTTTSTLLTAKVCGVLDPAAVATPLTACRRKRQYWLDVPIVVSEDESINAYIRQQFEPSPVLEVEPTQAVQFRNNGQEVVSDIESSYNEDMYVRSANPQIVSSIVSVKTSLASIASSVISSFLTPVETSTSVVTAYAATAYTTIFTASRSYTILACIPTGVNINIC